MIGLGTWEAPIKTMIYKGTGRMIISDVNGEYDFKFELVGEQLPEIKISDIVEDGNTLTATAECDLLKGKQIPVTVTFDGDKMSGMIKAPLIGRIKLEGTKIA
ncbi:MAG: hypothetical protein KBT46_08560 [Ruminococcus sp.]|nr:hypothetical protein [Candidatus Copronaster equi]